MQEQNLIATTQCLKDLARPLLSTLEFDSSEQSYRPGPLPKIMQTLKEDAKLVMARTEKHLSAGGKQEILGHVFLLLQHYYTAELSEAIYNGLAAQWFEVLKEKPEWAIKQAVTDYLSQDTKGRKPVPGQIRDLADRATSKYSGIIHQCRRILSAPLEPEDLPIEDRQASVARVNEIVKEIGIILSVGEVAH